jgi:hypothetical protein
VKQTRLESFIEAMFNVVIGFSINFAANIVLIPLFATDGAGHHAHISLTANWWMGCVYTAISMVRSYCIRRFFNAGLHTAAAAAADRVFRVRFALAWAYDTAVSYIHRIYPRSAK